MDLENVLAQIKRLQGIAQQSREDDAAMHGAQAQITEFLRQFAGPKSSFTLAIQDFSSSAGYKSKVLCSTLENFKSYLEAGLNSEVSPEQKARLEVVSDFLQQANLLLETKGVHPAAPIVLVGATLEEFLRTWVEEQRLSLGQRKPSLESYAQTLFAEDLITKQDIKDITSWGGLRNHAAHGQWSEVSDKQRAALMLDGVNLFMRKYSK